MNLNKKKQQLLFGLLELFYSSDVDNKEIEELISANRDIYEKDPDFLQFIEDLRAGSQEYRAAADRNLFADGDNHGLKKKIKGLASKYKLTKREENVVEALFSCENVDAAAKALCIGRGTFNNHLYSIYNKTGIDTKNHLFYLLLSVR